MNYCQLGLLKLHLIHIKQYMQIVSKFVIGCLFGPGPLDLHLYYEYCHYMKVILTDPLPAINMYYL